MADDKGDEDRDGLDKDGGDGQLQAGAHQGIDDVIAVTQADNGHKEGQAGLIQDAQRLLIHAEVDGANLADVAENQCGDEDAARSTERELTKAAQGDFDVANQDTNHSDQTQHHEVQRAVLNLFLVDSALLQLFFVGCLFSGHVDAEQFGQGRDHHDDDHHTDGEGHSVAQADGGGSSLQRVTSNDIADSIQRGAVSRGGGHSTGEHTNGLKLADCGAVLEHEMVGDQRDGHRDDRDHHTDDDKLNAVFFKDSADAAADLHADGDKEQHQEKCKELAIRIYNLDEEVYKCVGSSLGRTFTGQKETTLRHLAALMYTKPDGHLLRSELALISNMARTIRDKSERRRLMIEYDSILKEIESLPDTFGQTDIVDKERISLNNLIARRQNEISENDHLIICISRTQGSGGNDIGFELADQLQINYYDAEIFDQVMKRLQADKNAVGDAGSFEGFDKYRKKKHTDLKTWFREFNRYHGLPKQDAVFFNMSDLICELAKSEDCVIMGRCADMILKNNHIPHISLFISAPFQVRVQHVMDIRNMNLKQAVRFLKQMDKQHKKYYEFYTGEKWGKPENYDLCINSANYGLKDTIELIRRMLDQKVH